MKSLLSITAVATVFAISALGPTLASAEEAAATGTFTGANDHITTGGVSVVKTPGGGAVVILDADFSLDGAPDPSVGFGIDGEYVKASDLGDLVNIGGLQAYVVPASVNVDDFNEVYIWCDQFNVSLGVASLN
ncbi:DM13 domain-containing protein [Rhodobacteraceae bacterium]|nr:DM13 domain-containing protein [Paracoccaceae bacterium]